MKTFTVTRVLASKQGLAFAPMRTFSNKEDAQRLVAESENELQRMLGLTLASKGPVGLVDAGLTVSRFLVGLGIQNIGHEIVEQDVHESLLETPGRPRIIVPG